MKLYNTLTKKIEEIKPINPPIVTIYTCGPTVYDYPHVGNWFTFIRYDILARTLKLAGYSPKWVINITDVGHLTSDADEGIDKLEKGADREGKTAWEIADFYTDYFLDGMKRLGITKPQQIPRATQHIKEQISLIKQLEVKGYTYIIDDGVYYNTAKFENYNKFAQLDLAEQKAGARVNANPQKKNFNDFALWKFSPKNKKRDMEWDSPWGKGFPGWHIECSAMALKYLGETIDIHAGGIDHIPLHHTNEIAQSEAVTSKRLANYWMHTNFITINNEKIAKSLRNSITLEDIEKQKIDLASLRFLVTQSQYRNQSKFSWDVLTDAANSLNRIRSDFSWIYSLKKSSGHDSSNLKGHLSKYKHRITNALVNDLDTPLCLSVLHTVSKEVSVFDLGINDIPVIEEFAEFINKALGFKVLLKINLTNKQLKLIRDRENARGSMNWTKSDDIRQELEKEGIGLRDSTQGTIWYPL